MIGQKKYTFERFKEGEEPELLRGRTALAVTVPERGLFRPGLVRGEEGSPEQKRQAFEELLKNPELSQSPVGVQKGKDYFVPREPMSFGEFAARKMFGVPAEALIEQMTGAPPAFTPAQKTILDIAGWGGLTAPLAAVPTAIAGWRALATAPTAAKIAGRTALAPVIAQEWATRQILKWTIGKPVSMLFGQAMKVRAGIATKILRQDFEKTPIFKGMKPEFKGTPLEDDVFNAYKLWRTQKDPKVAEQVLARVYRDVTAGRYSVRPEPKARAAPPRPQPAPTTTKVPEAVKPVTKAWEALRPGEEMTPEQWAARAKAQAAEKVALGVATQAKLPSGTVAEIVETESGRIWEIRVRGEVAGELVDNFGQVTVFGGGQSFKVSNRAEGFRKLQQIASEHEQGILRRPRAEPRVPEVTPVTPGVTKISPTYENLATGQTLVDQVGDRWQITNIKKEGVPARWAYTIKIDTEKIKLTRTMPLGEIERYYKIEQLAIPKAEAVTPPPKVVGGFVAPIPKGSVEQALETGLKQAKKTGENVYVFPTAEGMKLGKQPPPFGLQHYITKPDGSYVYIEMPIPKAELGMPEAGLQPSMLEEVAAKEVRPAGKGVVTQIKMEDYAKLKEVEIKALAEKAEEVGMTGEEIMQAEMEVSGLKEWVESEPAAKLANLVKKVGWHKGEVSNLTKTEYRLLTGGEYRMQKMKVGEKTITKKVLVGGREPKSSILTKDGKYVRWEYALDDIATELGYKSGDELKDAIESVSTARIKIKTLESVLSKAEEKGPAEFAVAWEKPARTLTEQLKDIYADISGTLEATRASLKGLKGVEATAGRQTVKMMEKELAGINAILAKTAVPADVKALRHQIKAIAAFKGIKATQLSQILKDKTGVTSLTSMTKAQLEEVLQAVRKARPVKIKAKTVIKTGTERAIQSLKKELIAQGKFSEEAYREIISYLKLPTDKYISARLFITEREGRALIRQMNAEAEVGYIEWNNQVNKALEENEPLAKEIKGLQDRWLSDDPDIVRDITKFVKSLTWRKMPVGADVSGLWSARYRFEKLAIRTKDRRWHWIERTISDRAKTAENNVTQEMKAIESSSPYYKEIAADKKAQHRIRLYIASKLKIKGAPESPEDIKPQEIELAKKIEALFFKYRPEVRYDRFLAWYETFDGNVTLMLTKIKDAPRADLVQAIRTYESQGAEALRKFLNTKTWGIIESGYEPHRAIMPKLIDYKVSEAIIGKGRLSSREGVEIPSEDDSILKSLESYLFYMERLKLRPYFQFLSRIYSENMSKLTNPQKIKYQMEQFMAEAKGGRPIEHPVMRIGAKVAALGYNAIFKLPHLSFRNLHQQFAFSRDKSTLVNPLNRVIPEKIMQLFKIRDSQMKGARRDLLLYEVLGTGRPARFLKKTEHYPWSDEVGRLHTFWGNWNKADRAMRQYRETGDFQEFRKASGMNELTIQQQIDITQKLALAEVSYADGAVKLSGQEAAVYEIASNFAANVHFVYDRIGRSVYEYGPEGRVLTSLFIFPRSYFEQLYLMANRIKPGSKASIHEKARSWKGLMSVIVGGIIVGSIYELAAGKTRNPYSPLNMLTWSGGLAVGLSMDITKGIYLMVQAAQDEDWARSELTTHLPRMADSFVPFYGSTINILEALTDTRYIDRLALRKLRAELDKDYMPKEDYYRKERGILGKIQHALFGGEEPEPKAIEKAQKVLDEAMPKLGQEDAEAKQKAVEGVDNPEKVRELLTKDWTYTTADLGSDIRSVTYGMDMDTLQELSELVEYYWTIEGQRTYYYKELTTEQQAAYRETHPDFVVGMLFWGRWTKIFGEEASSLRALARKYKIPEYAIPALRKPEELREFPSPREKETKREPIKERGKAYSFERL